VKELFILLKDSLLKGKPLVLVTVTGSSGSTPRTSGAVMLAGKEGRIWGTIGGALPEHLALEEAKALVAAGEGGPLSSFKSYILHPNEAADIGARCGGEISVFFRLLTPEEPGLFETVEKALACFSAHVPCRLIMEIADRGKPSLILAEEGEGKLPFLPPGAPEHSGPAEEGGRRWFCLLLLSPGRVFVFGGGHVAQELVPLLARLDFRCVVFEDREEYSRPALFPGVEEVIRGDFEHIGDSLNLSGRDLAVIVTRGHVWDFEAWAFCLRSPAAYIGVIGSRHKHEFVKARLKERGFSINEIEAKRVRAPIGLDIKSETPSEIAVSIAAELILTRANLRENVATIRLSAGDSENRRNEGALAPQ
jgi:xanthine dehydrogenase accessory factor